MPKKKARTPLRTGRPRERFGELFRVDCEFGAEQYAQIRAYVRFEKNQAQKRGETDSRINARSIMRSAWERFWKSLPQDTRLSCMKDERYRKYLSPDET